VKATCFRVPADEHAVQKSGAFAFWQSNIDRAEQRMVDRAHVSSSARIASVIWPAAAGANRELAVDWDAFQFSKSGCIRKISNSVRMIIYGLVAKSKKNFRRVEVGAGVWGLGRWKGIHHDGTKGTKKKRGDR
jgi:hypothetical protein